MERLAYQKMRYQTWSIRSMLTGILPGATTSIQERDCHLRRKKSTEKNLEQLGLPYLEASWSYNSSTRRRTVAFGRFQESDTDPYEA